MCDDETPQPTLDLSALGLHREGEVAAGISDPFSRRSVLRAGSVAAALAVLAQGTTRPAYAAGAARRSSLTLPDGTRSSRHAMHVHSVGSERSGSVAGQVSLAEKASCDSLWLTEHDWRLFALPDERTPREYVFSALASMGWVWKPVRLGKASLAQADVTTVNGSTALLLEIAASTAATVGVEATSSANLLEGFVVGRQVVLPLQVEKLSGSAFVELVVNLSTHGGKGFALVYRFGARPDGRLRATPTVGHVYRQVAQGDRLEVTLTPLDDIEALFGGEMVAADNSITGLTLQVSAQQGAVRARVPRIGLPRLVTGVDALNALVSVYDQVFATSPVSRRHGIEVSGAGDHHIGWYGRGATNLPEPGLAAAVATIHSGPGVASYNHPFGTTPRPRTDARFLNVVTVLATSGVYGADVLELGYVERGGMSLDDHLLLGDLLWNRGLVFTANGVSDDHGGRSWKDTFLTHLWGGRTEASDLAALRSGRATVMRLPFLGDLAITLDGRPMGSVPSSSVRQPGELTILTAELPSDTTLEVVSGLTTVTGRYTLAARTTTTGVQLPRTGTGSVSVGVPGGDGYHRVVARDATGSIIAFTNPVWSGVPDPSGVDPSRVVRV
ncbi:MAG: hypothetical protein M3Y71_19070 [Actinomycetota bacterium]|nr:hypothetical protein [Actinomycetota bacterium]